jgi:Ca2+-binding RTX toxin-like protein
MCRVIEDHVLSSVSFTIGPYIEKLTLTGTATINATGNDIANTLTGNSAANTLKGLGGDDLLDGGTGEDRLEGGEGNDTFLVNSVGDAVVETGTGTDIVKSKISYTLGDLVENLTLLGSAANGTGNELDNTLIGNASNNVLNGLAGSDRLEGGAGNDKYVVDSTGDIVVESAGGGTDTVNSSVDFTLGAEVENLALTGLLNLNGTGNSVANQISGNAGANVLDGKEGADILQGGKGGDTYIVDNAGDQVIETALANGHDTVQSSITFTLGAYLDDLVLTGGDAINGTGNDLNNAVTGNSAANILDGKAGADAMNGGAGDDTYIVDNIGDTAVEAGGAGLDNVKSSVSFTLADFVENLTLLGTADINGTGNTDNNQLIGNTGANRLDGGVGADFMSGGLGNDAYVVDNFGDVVKEGSATGGIDGVESTITYTLGANLELLALNGGGNIAGYGNGLDNVIVGNGAGNLIDGRTGADTMSGLDGDDTYYVDNAGDKVIETSATAGYDKVNSTISLTLGANLEDLVLKGTAAINATGNDLANVLTGNAAANVLNGRTGADRMNGGAGDDVYVVDDAGDVAHESSATGGNDRVNSSVSYVLGSYVEQLLLTGTADINATGNGLANVLTGNAGGNVLNGKAGADTMNGGAGNDLYYVDNAADIVRESSATGGTDRVNSSVSFTLGSNVEQLTLSGSASVNGTGNALDNALVGNDGTNALEGLAGVDSLRGGAGNVVLNGGLGKDTLHGGPGADQFWFDAPLGAANADRILDFSSADDTICLSRSVFKALSAGALDGAAFWAGSTAHDADDRIIYDSATGSLYYDADGNGAGVQALFATVAAGAALGAADFLVAA